MRLGYAFVGVAAAVAVIGACTAFRADEQDAPAPADTASEASDSSSGEDVARATSDADHGPDGSAPDGGFGMRPCTASHWLCDDFDKGATIDPMWSPELTPDAGSSLAIDSVSTPAPPSPPSALAVHAPPSTTAVLRKSSAINGEGLHCELDILVEQPGSVESILVALSLMNPAKGSALYRVELRGPGSVVQYGSSPDGGPLAVASKPVPLTQGKWSHVVAEIATGAKQTVKLVLDGVPIVTSPTSDLTSLGSATYATVQIGASVYNAATSAIDLRVRYDNVFCDLIPP